MAYNATPLITWDRGTAADGFHFRDEFQRIYDNFNEFLTINGSDLDIELNGNIKCTGDIQGGVPVGTIIAWLPGYFTDGSNGGYTPVSVTLPDWWKECNGDPLNDADSPIYNGSNRYLPNLTDDRFLMGGTVGSVGGTNDFSHTHAFTQPSAHGITQPTFTYPNHRHVTGERRVNVIDAQRRYLYTVTGSALSIAAFTNTNDYTESTSGGYKLLISSSYSTADALYYTLTDGGGSCSRTTNVGLSNNHTGGAVGAATISENRPLYLGCKYIQRIK